MAHDIVVEESGVVLVDGAPEDRANALRRFAAEADQHGVPILVVVTDPKEDGPRLFHVDERGAMTPVEARTPSSPSDRFTSMLDPVRARVAEGRTATSRAAVTATCPHCASLMPAGLRVCGECGLPLAPGALAERPSRASAPLGVQRLLADVMGAPAPEEPHPEVVDDRPRWSSLRNRLPFAGKPVSYLVVTAIAAVAVVFLVLAMVLGITNALHPAAAGSLPSVPVAASVGPVSISLSSGRESS